MAKQSLVSKQTSKVLKTLLDNPELENLVPELEAQTLNKLIQYVGPEDAGPLVAYTSNRQLRAILDECLWSSVAPGAPEVHRPEEFIRWLYILQGEGEALLADRLQGLGIEYTVMNVSQLIKVNSGQSILGEDYQVLEQYAGSAAYAEEFCGYYVTAIYDEEWDITRSALVALQENHPNFLSEILFHLSRDAGQTLMHDISGERRDGKERAGFVSSESARAFLELTNVTELWDIVKGDNLDAVSVRYFSQLGTAANNAEDAQDDQNEPDEIKPSAAMTQERTKRRRALAAILQEAEILGHDHAPLMLSAPEQGELLPIKAILEHLQTTSPDAFATRLSELVYLSNVLISGTTLNGIRFDSVDAAQAVLATCNLGMSYLDDSPGNEKVVNEGLVRLFRIGWKILQQTPKHVVELLIEVMRAGDIKDKLFDRQWILEEMNTTLNELVLQVSKRHFDEVKDSLVFLSLVVAKEDCEALKSIIADYPQFPFADPPRHLESTQDLLAVDQFVRALGLLTDRPR